MSTSRQQPLEGAANPPHNKLPTYISSSGTINRKVAFASFGAAVGSLAGIIIVSGLLSIPWANKLSQEEVGQLKASIGAATTALVTLGFGYYVKPGSSDGIVEEQ